MLATSWSRWTVRLLSIALGVTLAAAFTAWQAYRSIGQVELNVSEARLTQAALTDEARSESARAFTEAEARRLADELAATEEALLAEELALAAAEDRIIDAADETNPFATSPPLPDEMFDAFLLIGADASGFLADAIILVLEPTDGSRPMMVSLPRDLYVPNPCSGTYTRINANLNGCPGVAGGSTMLSWAVEDFTGIEVDRFAKVDFEGFADVIDAIGGIDLCFEHPTRDIKADLDVPAGCQRADGETALAWVRSRRTEQLVNGEWVSTGASDFTRQRRQQDVLFLVASRLNRFSSIGSFRQVAQSVSDSVRLDNGTSFGEAIVLAWEHRGMRSGDVQRLSVPVENYRTSQGAAVLVPTESFNAVLSAAYPAARR